MAIEDRALAQGQWLRYCYLRDRGHLAFLHKADRCDNFFAGNQWQPSDLELLQAQRRPALTINKVLSTISTILGEQIYNRTEVLFRPSAGSPSETADALSKVWMQISQANQLPWLRSDVFCDGVVRSRGFYDVRMDFSDSVFGEVRITQLNSKNVVIDADAQDYDPEGWNDVIVTKWMTLDDIEVLHGKAKADALRESISYKEMEQDALDQARDSFSDLREEQFTSGATYGDEGVRQRRSVRVLDRQYRKLHRAKHFVDVQTGDMRVVPSDWDEARVQGFLERAAGQLALTTKLIKRIRWTVTAGDVVLHDDWSPYRHFTVVPYFPHFRYGRTVGIVENLLSPQEILNKASSQELHVINTTANSGWVVEENSLVNMSIEELEARGAQTGLVVEYRKGAEPPTKIQPNQIPSGLDRITYKAEEHIKTISAVSDSMQGFDREDVAAKAIAYKQQRGSVNLSKVLDNLERTDWILARLVLSLVQQYYSDERVLNITRDDFTRDTETLTINQRDPETGAITNDLTLGEYDIVITSSPYRASLEDSQFEQARALRELGIPIPDDVLIENSRLLRRGDIVKRMQDQRDSPEAQKQAQLQAAAAEAEVALKQAQAQKTLADAEKSGADALIKGAEAQSGNTELAKLQGELELERQRLDMELSAMRQEMALKLQEMQLKMQMEREKHVQEQEIKRSDAQLRQELQVRQAEQQAEAQRRLQLRQETATTNPSSGETDGPY